MLFWASCHRRKIKFLDFFEQVPTQVPEIYFGDKNFWSEIDWLLFLKIYQPLLLKLTTCDIRDTCVLHNFLANFSKSQVQTKPRKSAADQKTDVFKKAKNKPKNLFFKYVSEFRIFDMKLNIQHVLTWQKAEMKT